LVLQYDTSAYKPTASAEGTVGVSTRGFAKLSDQAINGIDEGDSTYDYFKFQGTAQTNSDVAMLFVRVLQGSFADTARNMGWGDNYQLCSNQTALTMSDCSSWLSPNGCERFDTQCVPSYAYDCNRWFMDYSSAQQCYNPTGTGVRCLSGNGHCGAPGDYYLRDNVRLYKWGKAR